MKASEMTNEELAKALMSRVPLDSDRHDDLRDACGTCGAKREVAELRKGISELLDALQAIYDEECASYGTGEVYDKWRKALKGASND